MIELRCRHCSRYIGQVETLVGEVICGNSSCKAGNQFKVINPDMNKMMSFKFASAPKPPKEKPTSDS